MTNAGIDTYIYAINAFNDVFSTGGTRSSFYWSTAPSYMYCTESFDKYCQIENAITPQSFHPVHSLFCPLVQLQVYMHIPTSTPSHKYGLISTSLVSPTIDIEQQMSTIIIQIIIPN